MGPRAVEQNQVDIEEQQVHDDRDNQQSHCSGEQMAEHTDLPEGGAGSLPEARGCLARVLPALGKSAADTQSWRAGAAGRRASLNSSEASSPISPSAPQLGPAP